MSLLPNAADSIRPGEELDQRALAAYLKTQQPGLRSDPVIRQFRHGHSNLTYLVSVDRFDYVLRRPPFGNQVKSAHDMGREFKILSALAPVFGPAPRPLFYCEDLGVLGVPFYLMERRHGVVLRQVFPSELMTDQALVGRLCQSMADTLAALHRLDYRAIGLADFGKPDGYVARQVKGWTERYAKAETEAVPDLDAVGRWLAENMPADRAAAVIHNDFKFDNVMLAAGDLGRVEAVLDWEMATIGDPLMDLGTALAYLLEPGDPAPFRAAAMGPLAPGMWTRQRFADRYAEQAGATVGNLRFYYVFGVFKLAVILQQIYARYVRGFTSDERFASFNQRVAVLARQAAQAL